MDAVLLSRIHFAFTIGFHYIFPPLTIGMSYLILYYQTLYLKHEDKTYLHISRFWTKIFALSFVFGVATGITMEFQFGTNWANYSRFVGDIFGAPLAAEAIFAFFLESTFLGILLYGEKKVSKRVYWFSSLMVTLGSTLSAFWIIVANSWQQTPAGYQMVNGRAELSNFFEAVFNPSTIPRFLHTLSGALITGAFFIMGISAYYLLKNRHLELARRSLKSSLLMVALTSFLIVPIGHYHAVQVTHTQPAKLAAFEGLWESGPNAPFLLFGLPNEEKEETDLAISIPGALSFFIGGSFDTPVRGLKSFKKENRPPLIMTFFSFHLMVILGGYFIFFSILGLFLLWKKKLYENKLYLKLALFSIPLPFLANELGWIAAEVGRQPWIVYNLLLTKEAISFAVPFWQICTSLALFATLYTLMFFLWIYLLKRTIDQGPKEG